jgi:IS5 family transposase
MREARELHEPLFRQYSAHPFSEQLARVSAILDSAPGVILELHSRLANGRDSRGAKGMSAENILRAALLMQAQDLTFDELSFQIADSQAARAFVRVPEGETFARSTLQANIAAIPVEIWQRLQFQTVKIAQESGLETGRQMRMDATVVETNISHPLDSTMLVDALRVVSRIVHWLEDTHEMKVKIPFKFKAGHKLKVKILNAKNDEERRSFYTPLIIGTGDTWRSLDRVLDALRSLPSGTSGRDRRVAEIENLKALLSPVLAQAIVRIIDRETVPASEKVISLFEPHSDVIIKGSREVEFGRKVYFSTGRSNLVADVYVAQGNPSDSDLFLPLLERLREIYGRVPRQTSCDGGFASQENVEEAKDAGVKDVCFTKRVALEPEEMCKSRWVFKKLAAFRAGIESNISALKRAFGLSRVRWKTEDGFMKAVWSSVCAYNLMLMAS